MAKMGRKDKYETHVQPFLHRIPDWCRNLNEREIATKLGVGKSAFYKYKKEHPELREALEAGSRLLVDDLYNALRRRAKGYDYVEVQETVTEAPDGRTTTTTRKTTKHVPPDLGSIHLLLKNLDPNWKNDDATTLAMKQKELELKEKKIENSDWL